MGDQRAQDRPAGRYRFQIFADHRQVGQRCRGRQLLHWHARHPLARQLDHAGTCCGIGAEELQDRRLRTSQRRDRIVQLRRELVDAVRRADQHHGRAAHAQIKLLAPQHHTADTAQLRLVRMDGVVVDQRLVGCEDRLSDPAGDAASRVVVGALNSIQHQPIDAWLGRDIAAQLQQHVKVALGNGLRRGGHRLHGAHVQRPRLALPIGD